MQDSQLAVQERPVAISSGMDIIQFALEKGAGVEVMERMLAMRQQLKAEAAKESFDSAMEQFQAVCPVVAKKRNGAKNAYKYAALEDIVEQTKDARKEHGFSHKWTQGVASQAGWVKAVVLIKHAHGHSEFSEFEVPIDDKNPMMTAPQRHAGAMMFAKRQAFCNGFGIVPVDEDNDAAGQLKDKPVGESGPKKKREDSAPLPHINDLKKELWALTQAAHKGDNQAFSQHLWDEGFIADTEHPTELSAERLAQVIAKVKATKKELF